MKTKKISIILILIVFAVSTAGFGCKKKEPEPSIEEPPIKEQKDQEPSEKEQLAKLAENYVQIYGTFTERDYTNLESLREFMSEEYREEIDDWLKTKKSQPVLSPTYSIITEIIISKIISFEVGYAEVLVVCKRTKTNVRTLAEQDYYQNCLVKFIKEDGVWKVDWAHFLTNK